MSYESDIYSTLAGYAGLSTLVGTKVYTDQADQGTGKPYVVWQEIDGESVNDLDGSASTGSTDIMFVQITAWADKAQQAIAVREQVRLAMEAATLFHAMEPRMRSLGKDQDTKLFGRQIDFFIGRAT